MLNSSGKTADMRKIVKSHCSWMVDEISNGKRRSGDEDSLVHQMRIKDTMERKQKLKGPQMRQCQRKSYIVGHRALERR